jgi:hypothetical protein
MKAGITIAALCSLATLTDVACAQPVLDYKALKTEARRVEQLEGSERVISSKILFKTARLNLRPFGGGSPALYVVKQDEIAFVCTSGLPKGFKGGWVTGKIEKHEAGAEGSAFYDLSNCRAE